MVPQPRKQFAFTAQYTGKSVCQLVQQFRANYIGSWHWSRHLVTIVILLISYHQSGFNPQTTGIFFQNIIWNFSLYLYCFVWNWSNDYLFNTVDTDGLIEIILELNQCFLSALIMFSIQSFLFHWHCSNHYIHLPSANEATLKNIGKWIT